MSARQFLMLPGKRESMPLFIGLVGPSSSGKTRSALELAMGIQEVVGGEVGFLNSEGRRGLVDMDYFRKPDGSPAITHMPFAAPYRSEDYLAGILQATAAGFKTLIIDSFTHEHDGEGGMLDYQDQELRRLAGDEYGTRSAERWNMLAWQKPKAERRKLLTRGIQQTDINIIACFRAKETAKPVKVPDPRKEGKYKTEVVTLGFTPIAGEEFVFEMALSAFLPPNSKGVPDWHPQNPGERMAVKRNDQLASIVPDGAQLSRKIGADLARWAQQGGKDAVTAAKGKARSPVDEYAIEVGQNIKFMDPDELQRWWDEGAERRLDLNIPEDRLAVMESKVREAAKETAQE